MNELTAVLRALDHLGLRYQQSGDTTVELSFGGQHIDFRVRVLCQPLIVSVIAAPPMRIPAERIDESIRLANVLNGRFVRWGCFWIDPESRQLTFEGAILSPEAPTQEQIELAFDGLCVNRCWPAFARVLWGGETAEAALTALSAALAPEEGSDPDASAGGRNGAPAADAPAATDDGAVGLEQII